MNLDDLMLELMSKALGLIERKTNLDGEDERLDWMDEALALLSDLPAKTTHDNSLESNQDYQFLKSIIEHRVDLYSKDIAMQLKAIISEANKDLISLFNPAVTALRDALVARSKQFFNVGVA